MNIDQNEAKCPIVIGLKIKSRFGGFVPESVTQTLVFMILLCNLKYIVLHDYLELEAEISTAKRSRIIFLLLIFGWPL